MKLKKTKLILALSSLLLLGGCTSSGAGDTDVTYRVTLDENDYCYVRWSYTSDVYARYYSGWTFEQYEDAYFILSKDGDSIVYSNSVFGYEIEINA